MNPEFERNLWLELTPRRVILMALVLALVFVASASAESSGRALAAISGAARILYFVLVVFWGTRTAGASIASEIRDRTWDFQRLSALTPIQILTGKLFGATSYQWLGGLVCLLLVALGGLIANGPGAMMAELIYLVSIGLFAQSIALFASLLAIHRRAELRRLDVFLFQLAGLAAAWIAGSLWDVSYAARIFSLNLNGASSEYLTWWDLRVPVQGFYLVSLLVFLAWSYVGNLTLLRSELQIRTSPLTWIGFLIFAVIYAAGFADPGAGSGFTSVRLAAAIAVTALLTYAAILFEHKDPVLYRWYLSELGRGRIDRVLGGLQSWMSALGLLTVLVIYFLLTFEPPLKEIFGFTQKLAPAVLAAYLFVLRDVGIFIYFAMAAGVRRGDFGALVTLAILYLVLPVMTGGLGHGPFIVLFYPDPDAGTAIMVGAPALEAFAIWALAFTRLRGLLRPAASA